MLCRRRGDWMEGKFLTDCGQIRSHNEDAGGIYYNATGQFLAIIADGMGGHQAGDVASQMVTSVIKEKWEAKAQCNTPEEAEKWLQETIKKMNQAVYGHAEQNKACQGMGTTVVISICTDDFVTIGHIGDSRCYLLTENGLQQITKDHSLVNELVRSGQISAEEAELHPRKNVLLKALGTEEQVAPDIQSISWEAGNKLLLCSDGLTNKLPDAELTSFLQQDAGMQEIGQKMVTLANERGGEDNISLVIAEHAPSPKEGEASC